MLKKIIVGIIVMLFVSPCFAQSREELIKSHNKLSQEISTIQQEIEKRRVQQIEIVGVLKYLEAKEKEQKGNSAVHNIKQ